MLAPLLHPLTLKALLVATAPWLVGGAALGTFAGRQQEENVRQREKLARQQAEIARLAEANADLAARVASQAKLISATEPRRPSDNTNTPKPNKKSGSKKQGFLKHILEANLKLRDKSKDSTGE
jgi:hypothetical protein